MKFPSFSFLAGFCLLAVSVSDEIRVPATNDNFIPKAFISLKTVDCAITDVLQLKGLIESYISDMQSCSSDVNYKLQPIIDICHQIRATLNDILHFKENVCNKAARVNSKDVLVSASAVQGKSALSCFIKLFHKTVQLLSQVEEATKLIKTIPLMYGDADECVNTSINNLTSIFNQFTNKVKTCSEQN